MVQGCQIELKMTGDKRVAVVSRGLTASPFQLNKLSK